MGLVLLFGKCFSTKVRGHERVELDGKGEETGAGTLRDRKYADFLLG